ncbi:SulP family inorganic anion transporter [Adlercreutzia shanghongiae]|uniref:SulP family inorganic anion transporter n=1 Tax=Adlercreutzia shanghongiae TaxID=3111773 RepID=A0ABU6IYL9_9ACTN|nr:SulP family inorganic anion transporter [Adlercreutzia sp. R22]MEC4294933.1 SulP family inorganic anion transporter [Adlercreutzia sp. R22]
MIIRAMKGYRAADVPKDLLAGLVIAALSIPIAMGYAEVVGLPAIYGLWASIIAPLSYGLFTSTRRVVFGMDSAAAAMTASMLAAVGVTAQGDLVAAMPLLTLFTALFLVLLGWVRAGRFIRRMPLPVMHGFIFGIALTVVIGQVPLLLGTTGNTSGTIVEKIAGIAACLPGASAACVIVSALCIAGMCLLKRFAPKVPAAIVVLVAAAVACNGLESAGFPVVFLPEVSGTLPQVATVYTEGLDVVGLLLAGFAIAVVVSLESLLCVETFSAGEVPAPAPDGEMRTFGIANALAGLIGCPPCSASMSRTAAGIASGSVSQVASLFSALIVAVVAFAAGSFMSLLPRCALSAIVVVALLDIVDFGKISTYALKTRREFMVFALSAALVVLFGAVAGILGGFILALALRSAREKIDSSGPELLGAVPYKPEDLPAKKDIDVGFKLGVAKLSGNLSFMNIAKAVEEIEAAAAGNEALILKLSKLDTIDTTAADKLDEMLDSLMERGVHVKLVRPIKETSDHYTRYELRRLMQDFKFYPSVRTAMHSLAEEYAAEQEPQRPDTWLADAPAPRRLRKRAKGGAIIDGDRPVVAIAGLRNHAGDVVDSDGTPFLEDIRGKLSFMQSRHAFQFAADYLEGGERGRADENGHFFSKLLVWDDASGEIVFDYRAGAMRTCRDEAEAVALMEPIDRTIREFALAQ